MVSARRYYRQKGRTSAIEKMMPTFPQPHFHVGKLDLSRCILPLTYLKCEFQGDMPCGSVPRLFPELSPPKRNTAYQQQNNMENPGTRIISNQRNSLYMQEISPRTSRTHPSASENPNATPTSTWIHLHEP